MSISNEKQQLHKFSQYFDVFCETKNVTKNTQNLSSYEFQVSMMLMRMLAHTDCMLLAM